jgi:hypothetical protein
MRWMWTLFIALWVSVPAHAGSSTEASSQSIGQGTVQVRVWSVHATKQGNGMDERLGRVAKHLKVLDYSGFELLQKDSSGIPVKGAKKFPVAGGRTVRVSILSQNEKRARVRVQVSSAKGTLLDTTVSIRRNGFFIVAGPRYKGGILVLPIFARY